MGKLLRIWKNWAQKGHEHILKDGCTLQWRAHERALPIPPSEDAEEVWENWKNHWKIGWEELIKRGTYKHRGKDKWIKSRIGGYFLSRYHLFGQRKGIWQYLDDHGWLRNRVIKIKMGSI